MPFRKKKISSIGAGQLGATCALVAASRSVARVPTLVDDISRLGL